MNGKVRELRKALGFTLEKFGERLGVKKAVLSQIENGKSNLTEQMLKAICNVNWDGKYVNEDWMRGNSDKMFKASPTDSLYALAEEYSLSHEDCVLIEKFVNLKAEKRAAVVEYILQAAAAMQSEGADPNAPAIFSKPSVQTPLDPNTATDEEKMAAYKEYLDEKGEKRRKAN